MNLKHKSDSELLALLVGRDLALRWAGTTLAELFGIVPPRELRLGEKLANYALHPALAAAKELVARCLLERMRREDACLSSPDAVKDFLALRLAHLGHEVFWCLWLDSQNRLIEAEEMFRGTLTQTSVYPREVVKQALAWNAAGVIFAHNHPSGVAEPSRADELLTSALKSALTVVDVKVLDHFIVAANQSLSFAARGLL